MESLKKMIGKRLQARRKELGLTQQEVAEKIGPKVDQGKVSRWESGENLPRKYKLKLLSILKINEAYLTDELKPNPTVADLLAIISRQELKIQEQERDIIDLRQKLLNLCGSDLEKKRHKSIVKKSS